MRASERRIAAAEAAVAAARTELGTSFDELQHRFSPSTLLNEAGRELRARSLKLGLQALFSPALRPIAATLASSALGWAITRRSWIGTSIKLFLGLTGATRRRAAHSSNRGKSRTSAARVTRASAKKETEA